MFSLWKNKLVNIHRSQANSLQSNPTNPNIFEKTRQYSIDIGHVWKSSHRIFQMDGSLHHRAQVPYVNLTGLKHWCQRCKGGIFVDICGHLVCKVLHSLLVDLAFLFTPLDTYRQTEVCQAMLRHHYEPAVHGKREERAWGR